MGNTLWLLLAIAMPVHAFYSSSTANVSIARIPGSFTYDFMGRRVSKQVEAWTNSAYSTIVSNKFVYDGWNLVAELNGTNNSAIRTYLWGMDLSGSMQGAGGVGGLLAVKDTVNATHFAAYDGNGNVTGLFSAADGTSSAVYEYDPFGNLLRATGPMAKVNPFRFSTKYQDDETDWSYYGYRFYNASVGRWLSRDPVYEISARYRLGHIEYTAGAKALSIHWDKVIEDGTVETVYGFIGNESVSSVDYLGLLPAGTATKVIPDCAIEIYAGHGYLDAAFDADDKLIDPTRVASLPYPHILKGTKCSAGTIISCNTRKYASVEQEIPGSPIADSEQSVAAGYGEIDLAVKNAKKHAQTICNSCPTCTKVTITVNCFKPFKKGGGIFGRGGSPWCGMTITIPCKPVKPGC